jgi:hypothetical protein
VTAAPAFHAWLDDFFASYYRHRPVNATFIGRHEHDHRLPDYSPRGVEDVLADMETLLARLAALPEEPLTVAERMDRRLAAGFLRIQLWEYRSGHFVTENPAVYTGEAIFGVLGLFLTDFAPPAERVAAAIERLHAIPALLAQGEANVRAAPAAWTQRALRECTGARAFLTGGIDDLIAELAVPGSELRAAADRALAAFDRFQAYLEGELLRQPSEHYACGAEVFDLLLKHGHCLEKSAADIARYAETQLIAAETYLAAHAGDFGVRDWRGALAQLADLHPSVEAYYGRYTELWEASRAMVESKALVTWPDFPLRYVPRPRWARSAAPYLYFLFYRSPAAFERPPVHDYLVTPIAPDLPAAEQQALLRANNDSVIKLNHVVHHGGVGHHIQNWHACRAPSRIGQVAAVDCAARIALFCGGTMAEGWACYATDLMHEAGFLTPLEGYSEQHTRLRMAARAIVDVRLHTGEMTLDDAARFYERHTAMAPEAAQGEAVKNSMFPGGALMYLVGTDGIPDLRRELAARQGGVFDLRQFHDRFLSFGSVPVSLVSEAMRGEVEKRLGGKE